MMETSILALAVPLAPSPAAPIDAVSGQASVDTGLFKALLSDAASAAAAPPVPTAPVPVVAAPAPILTMPADPPAMPDASPVPGPAVAGGGAPQPRRIDLPIILVIPDEAEQPGTGMMADGYPIPRDDREPRPIDPLLDLPILGGPILAAPLPPLTTAAQPAATTPPPPPTTTAKAAPLIPAATLPVMPTTAPATPPSAPPSAGPPAAGPPAQAEPAAPQTASQPAASPTPTQPAEPPAPLPAGSPPIAFDDVVFERPIAGPRFAPRAKPAPPVEVSPAAGSPPEASPAGPTPVPQTAYPEAQDQPRLPQAATRQTLPDAPAADAAPIPDAAAPPPAKPAPAADRASPPIPATSAEPVKAVRDIPVRARRVQVEGEGVSMATLPQLPDAAMPSTAAAVPEAKPADLASAVTAAAAPAPLAEVAMRHRLDLAQGSQWLDQLARDIASTAGTDGALKFRLNPNGLGSLAVEVRHGLEGAHVRLTAETEAARAIIADAQPRLVQEARAQGVRIAQAQVDLGRGGTSGSPHQQAEQQRHQQQQHGGQASPFIRAMPLARARAGLTVNQEIAATAERYA